MTFLLGGLVIVGVGSFLTARWIVRPLETLSRAARALGSGDLRARTGLKRQDELGEVGRAFDDMAERVQTLLVAERELLANVSHELRTPLARIRVALDLAGEADVQGERTSLDEIHVDLTEIERLIDDIMTTARLDIEDGRAPPSGFSLHLQRVAPEEICDRAAERFRTRHPRRPLTVAGGPDASLPAVDADPVLFRRVLDNLLENADKYSSDLDRPILLRTSAGDGRVTFEVVDRGMGIPEEDLPRIFTPFFRSERSRSRDGGGVGLGLTLVKRIVEAHEGCIDVTSSVGQGTTVRVSLPAACEARLA
jgi:signal transduction histidine kinase